MNDLPDEVLTHLVAIAPSAVADLVAVSKRLCHIATDDLLWKALYVQRFGPPQSTRFLEHGKGWRWLYRAHLPATDFGHAGDTAGMVQNGDFVYSGDLMDGLPHGWGTMVRRTPTQEEPEKRTAHGGGVPDRGPRLPLSFMYKWSGVESYEGEWHSGRFSGLGILVYRNGDHYAGEWRKGVRDGRGVYHAIGWQIDAAWSNDLLYGDFVATLDGCVWTGRAIGSSCSHPVSLACTDGARARGDVYKGRFNGVVLATCADGARYTGNCRYGKPHGLGALLLPDGSLYEALWYKGALYGAGLVVYPDGSRWEGTWEDGRRIHGTCHHRVSAAGPGPCACLACLDGLGAGGSDDQRVVPLHWPTEHTMDFLDRAT
ncbi:Morn repeat domain containing protein [Pandoravirus neocaledonia]|uniref:Morn repeat domain containing protein n=1 Tax=Pandoravirus neocaledonia TaxID=2107708 RepID=A0A2U7UC82_9VIRU|nr:Morn repeat domain containing protein [Pandoravirus neocaledonia]AVK76067.1 Morn repeat domain containing protein [Pandoravirus neocaledonia]